MLVRIVRMTFASDKVDRFLAHFDKAAPHIRSFPGCHHLELWRDIDSPTACTTYSQWESPEALDEYRDSDLFHRTWSTVKPLFADRPRVQSYTVARPARTIDDAARQASGSRNT
ncbi:putative quinol monooxygenase [Salinibacter altiplanensis]|uniref:putative quinol monooxygenase n=1 Tax=Salinibacter altiplanensis TaxID=1803181 RepID=UPI000C9F5B85|nr:putative quinol monooxygenase [Salinibacter altiplanensis]